MGSPKPALILGEATFFERVLSAATPVFDRVLEVTRADRPSSGGIETILEPTHEGTSPLFGIAAALEHARAPVWVIATDYPLVTGPLLRFLRARFEAATTDALLPFWDHEPQMLCAGYRPGALPAVRRRIDAAEFRVRDLIREIAVTMVDETELRARFSGEPLLNVNTREEFERIRRTYAQ